MRQYCICGAITEYSLEKPKFCSSCGKNFNESLSSITVPQKNVTVVSRNVIVNPDEDCEDIRIPIDLKKLELNIDLQKPSREKLSDIAGTESISLGRPKTVKNKKAAVKKLLSDCAPRTKPIELDE